MPPEIYFEWSSAATDNGSLVYLIDSGVDNPDANNTNDGNCYVKVQVCDVKLSKGELSKSRGKKKVKRHSTTEEFLRKCTSSEQKREFEGDEEKAEAEVEDIGELSKSLGKKKFKRDSNSGEFLKKCTSSEQKREFEGDEEKAEVEDTEKSLKVGRSTRKRSKNGEKNESLKFKLNPVWRRSFFGGPMVDIGEHVYAAFVIKS
ncbi:hypothetical protein RND81_11G006800 [Saponaria officinalis]|uniref:Uncharacterized protein n=1 Tax=Saponaria officinalis TaxID=3572 RepID=A0AAW1HGE1_SAPOF